MKASRASFSFWTGLVLTLSVGVGQAWAVPLRVVQGSYVGNGALIHFVSDVGFRPEVLILRGDDASSALLKTDTMGGTLSKPLGGAEALVSNGIVSFTSTGFMVSGVGGRANNSGVVYHWIAFAGGDGQIAHGSYAGDGTDNRDIVGLGFDPDYVWVAPRDAQSTHHRFRSEAPNESQFFSATSARANRIQDFVVDGFQIGSHPSVNKTAVNYDWVAWTSASAAIGEFSYLGDGIDGHQIGGLGFAPSFVLVESDDNTGVAVLRFSSMVGPTSLPVEALAPTTDGISQLGTDGFVVSGTNNANRPNGLYFGVAFQTTEFLDLAVDKVVDNPNPLVGDLINFRVRVSNLANIAATGVVVRDSLPSGLIFDSAVPSAGNYDPLTGQWTVGTLGPTNVATLDLAAIVGGGSSGKVLVNQADLIALDQIDTLATNDSAQASVAVGVVAQAVDVAVALTLGQPSPAEGDTLHLLVDAQNLGVGLASGTELRVILPAELSLVDAQSTQGFFDGGSGRWFVGDLNPAAVASLDLRTVVVGGTAGNQAVVESRLVAVDQIDLDSSNDRASVAFTVAWVDVEITADLSNPRPLNGDLVHLIVRARNLAPFDAVGVVVADSLPPELLYLSDLPSAGTYDAVNGIWNLGQLAAGATDSLDLVVKVVAGNQLSPFETRAEVVATTPVDIDGSNDVAISGLQMAQVDLGLTKVADRNQSLEGEAVNFTISLTNAGPDVATSIVVEDSLQATWTYVASTATHGAYSPVSRTWSGFDLGIGEQAVLVLTATVGPGTAGQILTNGARVLGRDQVERDPTDDSDLAQVQVVAAAVASIQVVASPQTPVSLSPGAPAEVVFEVELLNQGPVEEWLDGITFRNRTIGGGSQAQLDADWSGLRLDTGSDLAALPLIEAEFIDGLLSFDGLNLLLPVGKTVRVRLWGGASLVARDGDQLDVSIETVSDLRFVGVPNLSATFPLSPFGSFVVDGMSAAQILTQPLESSTFLAGSTENVAMVFVVPANGYAPDVLAKLNVVNLGDALPGSDIESIRAWADDGDLAFSAVSDTLLGTFAYTGARWELTGMNLGVRSEGRVIFMTVAIADLALPGRTVRLALPAGEDAALGMASGNDGTTDRIVASGAVHPISAADRVSLVALPIDPGNAAPGADSLLVLQLSLTNSYTFDQTLTSIRVTNTTLGPGTQAELDGEVSLVSLRADGDRDGVLTTFDADPLLATSFFQNGQAEFAALSWTIPADSTGLLFVTLRISDQLAADGDLLAVEVADPVDVGFLGEVATAASWPLDSGARWSIDGMLASQVVQRDPPSLALGPGEGPALAFEVVIPANGYQADVLNGIQVQNLGTAVDSDLAELRLWRDGGDGSFDASAGDDLDLGAMVSLGGGWQSVLLDEPISPPGARFYVGVRTSTTATDSATVRLQLPVNGISMASQNDGPTDAPLANLSSLLISQAPLLAQLELSPSATTVGDSVRARMILRNVSGELVQGITPSALTVDGGAVMVASSGPWPPTFDLAAAMSDTFEWTYTAVAAGETRLRGNASGLGSPSGIVRVALPALSNQVQVFTQADSLGVSPVVSAPFSVNRGQTNVIPMSLTFDNPAGAGGSDILLTALRLRLESSQGSGIVPSDLISRIVVNEGTQIYLEKLNLESSGAEIDLSLASPVTVIPEEPATLNLQMDLLTATVIPDFRVVLMQSSWMTAEDANSGAPILPYLQEGGFPVVSGLATVLAEAESLAVSAVPLAALTAAPGQSDLGLGSVSLENVGVTGLTSDVRVHQLQFSLLDSNSVRVALPGEVLSRIRVTSLVQGYVDLPVTIDADSILVVDLSPQISAAVNSPLGVEFRVDLRAGAPLGRYRLRLEEPSTFVASDAITRTPVVVSYDILPMDGPWLGVQGPVTQMRLMGTGTLPSTLAVGATEVGALELRLRHPGAENIAEISVDSLWVRAFDENRQPRELGGLVSGIRVLWRDSVVTDLAVLSSAGPELELPLGSQLLAAGDSASLELRIDLAAGAIPGIFELIVDDVDVVARDVNTTDAVAVVAEPGAALPVSSGLGRIVPPSTQLVVDLGDLAPATLVRGQSGVDLANLRLANGASPGSAELRVRGLHLRSTDQSGAVVAIGTVLSELEVYEGGGRIAVAANLSPDSTTAFLDFGEIAVPVGSPRDLVIRGSLDETTEVEGLRIGFEAGDLVVVSTGVVVSPEAGKSFPLWTSASSLETASFAESYSNFPNPFRAGRESTTFAYYLDTSAQVSLRVFMLTGEPVVTVLDAAAKSAGMHQEDQWDGRNGSGRTIRNGVYLARILVEYDDGRRETQLRRVAVVR